MKNYLLITIGHNSSAIFVDNTSSEQKIIGYEQERLSRIKADSQFPIDAINEIERNIGNKKMYGCRILVSHWFNTKWMDNPHVELANKYISKTDLEKLNSYNPCEISFTSNKFSHHDAHAYSAHAFFKYHVSPDKLSSAPHHTLVVDGFGNDEEVLSLYVTTNKKEQPILIHRVYGYYYSLGLFYQYATSFVGMKQNQDEYKFLGYESHIDEVLSTEQIDCLDHYVDEQVRYFTKNWMTKTAPRELPNNDIIDRKCLSDVAEFWHSEFRNVCQSIGLNERTSFEARCAIAYFIQQTCEIALSQFIHEFGVNNLSVAGGVFYNVKLNNKLLTEITGLFCAMPLAGDQGAAIGMYEAENKEYAPAFDFSTLAWGKRRLYDFKKFVRKGIYYEDVTKDDTTTFEALAFLVAKHIANGAIVNLVFGNMEFGPRALGNTSTLFLPTSENTAINNAMNKRNEVMPCAPICTEENARKLFDTTELDRVVGSDRFMICTHEYTQLRSQYYNGVMHKKPLDVSYTGRPQIVRKHTFIDLVLKFVQESTDTKCLVNTSFNAHGNPIVFDTKEILDNYNFQCEHAEKVKPILYVINIHE